MDTILLPQNFKEFLALLNNHHVEYLLVGGYAVGYYGYPRATADMEIWVAIHPTNADKLMRVLNEFGFDHPDLHAGMFLKDNQIIRLGVPPIRIEIITTISGVLFSECYVERVKDNLDGIEVNLISLTHLKTNKLASGRHKDLDDLENLP
jgi:predicted nucleotidyltransferase